MNNDTTRLTEVTNLTPAYAYGQRVYDTLDKRVYRFSRWEPSVAGFLDAVLLDTATGRELPDTRHPSQIRPA